MLNGLGDLLKLLDAGQSAWLVFDLEHSTFAARKREPTGMCLVTVGFYTPKASLPDIKADMDATRREFGVGRERRRRGRE